MDPADDGKAADLIRGYRKAAGLTQQELADVAALSVGVVRDLEQGRTGRLQAGSASRLSRALGLDERQAAEFRLLVLRRAAGYGPVARPGGQGEGLRLSVLGPLAAWRGGVPLALGAPRQRAVLALLALNPNTGLHREAIIDALWQEDPPDTAVNLVQAYVSRSRRVLDPGREPRDPDGLLVSAGTCYRLRITAGQLDLLAFRELAGRARTAASCGNAATACEFYEEALGLWRGEPLAELDVLRGHLAVTEVAQQHAALTMDYAEAAATAGLHQQVIPHLRALAGREPLNEKAHAQLMIALSGCGQQAAALKMFEDLRRRLDDQLGVYPGAELASAHQAVLRQQVPAAPTARTWSAAVQPDGRPGQPVRLREASPRHRSDHPGHRRRAGRPAHRQVVPRQLPAAAPHFTGRAAALAALSRTLGSAAGAGATVAISAIGGTAGAGKTALAVHWAHHVADRFPDGQLYVNLRGFDPSGEPLTPAEAARGFLDALAVPPERIPAGLDAQVGLYRSLLAGRRVIVILDNARDAAQVRPLLPGTPGCLALVTSRCQLTGLAAADGAHLLTLDVLTEAEARQMLLRRLGATRVAAEPEAASELIRLCARLPLALAIAAARVADRGSVPIAALTAELRDVTARLDAQLPWVLESFFDWRGHWQDWYATQRTALAAARRSGDLVGVACAHRELGAASTSLGDHDRAHSNLSRALGLFRRLGDRVGEARCHELIGLACESQGRHRQALTHHEEALRLYGEAAHRAGQARARNSIGWNHAWLGNYRQALRWCQQALAQTRELGDRLREDVTWDSLGYAHHHLGHYREAIACYRNALRLYRELGNLRNRATTLAHLGDTYQASGHEEAAGGAWKQALEIFDGLHHPDAAQLRAKVRALEAGTPLPPASADAGPGPGPGRDRDRERPIPAGAAAAAPRRCRPGP